TIEASFCTLLSVTYINVWYFFERATNSIPFIAWLKNLFPNSGIIIAIVWLRFPRKLLAYKLGEKPSSSAFARIRSFVFWLMSLLSRNARDTVDLDSPNFSAKSIIVICDISFFSSQTYVKIRIYNYA